MFTLSCMIKYLGRQEVSPTNMECSQQIASQLQGGKQGRRTLVKLLLSREIKDVI
jgi:hypothetical protein